ncbi:MAG TPA: VOC family protein [Streptosporangiaceae bacterium]|nr:VOC family protein [Streptosporangiaceae bacterium]
MEARPRLTVTGTNIDAPDANAPADFYRRLLGWETGTEEPGWVILRAPGGGHTLNFQTEERYAPPVWPASSRRTTSGSASTRPGTPSACTWDRETSDVREPCGVAR